MKYKFLNLVLITITSINSQEIILQKPLKNDFPKIDSLKIDSTNTKKDPIKKDSATKDTKKKNS